jgi:threonyl-tRNA synthetase
MGILIEHYGGAFPLWLAPVQVRLVPVSSKHVEGAQKLFAELAERGIRMEIDEADETVGKKIRNAAGQKIPYIVVVGDKELAGEEWMIRVRGQEEQVKMTKDAFVELVLKQAKERTL